MRLQAPWLCSAALALALVVPAAAQASEALAEQHACLNCHQTDKKLVGPAFKAVAEKYRGVAGADVALLAKIKNGGSGVWGAVPMPGMPQVPPDDARALVAWLLKL